MLNFSDGAYGGTVCLSKAGLKIGNGDAKDLDIAAPNGAGVDYAIDGILYHEADAVDIAITAAAAQAAYTTCLYLVCLDATTALSTVKGTEINYASWAAKEIALEWPRPVAGTCPIGAVQITTGNTTFTAGTTDFSAANVTDTYYDLFTIPPMPLKAA